MAQSVPNAIVSDDRALGRLGVGFAPAYGLKRPAAGIHGHARAAPLNHDGSDQ